MNSLVLNLDGDRKIEIDNTHEAFEDSDYAGTEFIVTAKPISQTKLSQIRKQHTTATRGGSTVDGMAQDRDIFVSCVTGWTGIEKAPGVPILCTPQDRAIVADQAWAFASRVAAAIVTDSQKLQKVQEAQLGN